MVAQNIANLQWKCIKGWRNKLVTNEPLELNQIHTNLLISFHTLWISHLKRSILRWWFKKNKSICHGQTDWIRKKIKIKIFLELQKMQSSQASSSIRLFFCYYCNSNNSFIHFQRKQKYKTHELAIFITINIEKTL